MRYVGHLGALSLLCVLGGQSTLAQADTCGDEICVGKVASVSIGQAQDANMSTHSERCQGLQIEVTASSADERRLACSAAGEAMQLLGRCGIALRRPLHVQIMNEVRHPFSGSIFGLLDTKRERVLITQEANIPALVKDTPYAMLPQREFYMSLIVHEVVHGVMHQNLMRPATSHAAYEYPAYALQIESLPADVRQNFLSSFDQAATSADFLFNDSLLLFDPFFFAARAYEHFKASPDGCFPLREVLKGDASFILAAPGM